jgi:hypothetical protein
MKENRTMKSAVKKTIIGLVLLGAVGVQAAPPTITQQVTPGTMSYQGRLQTPEGNDYVNGIYTIEFRLYDGPDTDATMLWGATYKPYVNNGFFSVILGQVNVGEDSITGAKYPDVADFWKGVWIGEGQTGAERYLGITVRQNENNANIQDADESYPRQQLLASPFAIQARFAEYAKQASGNFSIATNLYVKGELLNNTFEQPVTVGDADGLKVEHDHVVGGALTVGEGINLEGGTISSFTDLEDRHDLQIQSLGWTYIDSYWGAIFKPASSGGGGGVNIGNPYDASHKVDLYVSGDLKMRNHHISHVVESPRSGFTMLSGRVRGSDGHLLNSSGGFSVTRDSEGIYTITFSEAFKYVPVVVASAEGWSGVNNWVSVQSVSTLSCKIQTTQDNGTAAQDSSFHFIAIGAE